MAEFWDLNPNADNNGQDLGKWGNIYYQDYVSKAQTKGITPISKDEFVQKYGLTSQDANFEGARLKYEDEIQQEYDTNQTNELKNKPINDFNSAVEGAFKNKLITEEQRTKLYGMRDAGQLEAGNSALSTLVTKATNLEGTPKWQYQEPDYITQAKKIIQGEMNLDPKFNPDIVKTWLPMLQEATAGAKTQEYGNNAELMNSMGRLFSGQTVQNSQNINNKYTMDALNKAMGYAGEDYARQLATKQSGMDKNLAMGQYETGLSQYTNQQDLNEALRNLGNSWNTINTNKSQNYNDIQSAINRMYSNQDWSKNADLSREIANLSNPSSDFDWTKLLGPAATIGSAVATGGGSIFSKLLGL